MPVGRGGLCVQSHSRRSGRCSSNDWGSWNNSSRNLANQPTRQHHGGIVEKYAMAIERRRCCNWENVRSTSMVLSRRVSEDLADVRHCTLCFEYNTVLSTNFEDSLCPRYFYTGIVEYHSVETIPRSLKASKPAS